MNYQLAFFISGTLWAIEMIPQIVKTIRRKLVEDISLPMYIIATISFSFFFLGCILSKNWLLLYAHILPFLGVLIMLSLIVKYRRKS